MPKKKYWNDRGHRTDAIRFNNNVKILVIDGEQTELLFCRMPRAKPYLVYSTCVLTCYCGMIHIDEGAGRCCAHVCNNCGEGLLWRGWIEWVNDLKKIHCSELLKSFWKIHGAPSLLEDTFKPDDTATIEITEENSNEQPTP